MKDKKKIIFLDFDGVLILWDMYAPANYVEPNCTRDGFNIDCVHRLNELIKKTDAYLVFSTSWGNIRTTEQLQDILLNNAVKCENRVLGKIKTYRELDYTDRGEAIKDYLVCNDMIDSYGLPTSQFVIIDDEFEMNGMLNNFIKCDQKYGFTEDCLSQALKILA